MKVGIFETEHFEGAFPVIKLFDTGDNDLVIFTNDKTYKRFADLFKNDVSRFQWVVIGTSGSKLQFFKEMYRSAKAHNPDIFYINTISSNHFLQFRSFFTW